MTDARTEPLDLRQMAVERLKKKSDFKAHLLAYVLVNTCVVTIWAVAGGSFFWPVFPILGWGIGLVFHWWDAYHALPPTEAQIRQEMDSLRRENANYGAEG
jgi:hypothetical protein